MGLAYKFDWSVLWREPYGEWMLQGIWPVSYTHLTLPTNREV